MQLLTKNHRRMKQLEQRVETLMDMLSATGAGNNLLAKTDSTTSATTGSSITSPVQDDDTASSCGTSEYDDTQDTSDTFASYDPVETGLLNEDAATILLDEFRQGYSESFPFVIVDSSIDAGTLRREKSFLFLAIMAAMTHRMPIVQRALADAFKDQVAVRIVGHAHRGLEILQGLLIHSAYSHYYYTPGRQQLALMIQMCVAMAQELGFSKKCKGVDLSDTKPVLSAAEDRALLGTYYLAAA
jgi:hypothetical protein